MAGVLSSSLVAGATAAIVAALIFTFVFRAMWRVAEPNEALIISGFRSRRTTGAIGESMGV